MKYIYGVLIPLLIQVLIVYVTIEMNTGNGSFVGLGAYLLGLVAVPLTAIVNGVYIYTQPKLSSVQVIIRCLVIAMITPIIIIMVSVLG